MSRLEGGRELAIRSGARGSKEREDITKSPMQQGAWPSLSKGRDVSVVGVRSGQGRGVGDEMRLAVTEEVMVSVSCGLCFYFEYNQKLLESFKQKGT